MPLPAGVEFVTVTASEFGGGGNAKGSIDFASPRTLHAELGLIGLPTRYTAALVDGAISIDLPVGGNPADGTWRVTERVQGGSSYSILLLAANGPVQDLSALAPVASSAGTPVVVGPPGPEGPVGPEGPASTVPGPAGPAMTDAALAIPDQPTGEWGVELIDTAANLGGIMHIDHSGRGGTGSYGIDIRNRPGAAAGLVGHQYSAAGPFMQLDNTDAGTLVYLRNASNIVFNPTGAPAGTSATGPFLKCLDINNTAYVTIYGRGEVVLAPGADAATHGLEIIGSTTAARKLARFSHNGPANGVEIISAGAAAGFYSLSLTSLDYGVKILTTTNNGHGLLIQKDATGTGLGFKVTNKGTGRTAEFATAAASVAGINADGEYEHLTAGKGILLRSPDGTRYRVAVANGGAVAAVAA